MSTLVPTPKKELSLQGTRIEYLEKLRIEVYEWIHYYNTYRYITLAEFYSKDSYGIGQYDLRLYKLLYSCRSLLTGNYPYSKAPSFLFRMLFEFEDDNIKSYFKKIRNALQDSRSARLYSLPRFNNNSCYVNSSFMALLYHRSNFIDENIFAFDITRVPEKESTNLTSMKWGMFMSDFVNTMGNYQLIAHGVISYETTGKEDIRDLMKRFVTDKQPKICNGLASATEFIFYVFDLFNMTDKLMLRRKELETGTIDYLNPETSDISQYIEKGEFKTFVDTSIPIRTYEIDYIPDYAVLNMFQSRTIYPTLKLNNKEWILLSAVVYSSKREHFVCYLSIKDNNIKEGFRYILYDDLNPVYQKNVSLELNPDMIPEFLIYKRIK